MIYNLVTAFLVTFAAVAASEVTTAQAAEPATLTLACKGTATSGAEGAKPEPISMGIIVNFTNNTVQSQGCGFPIGIVEVNEVTIIFSDFAPSSAGTANGQGAYGAIDRVTGDVNATYFIKKLGKVVESKIYDLKCRPAQRMF